MQHRSRALLFVSALALACGSSNISLPAGDDDAGRGAPDASTDAPAADSSLPHDASASDAPTDLIPPVSTCAPSGTACSGAPVTAVYASYRKDVFLSESAYAEQLPDPTSGGRVQIALVSAVTGNVTSLSVDGQDADVAVSAGKLDWYHVWPRAVKKGEPVWVALHSHDAGYDTPRDVPLAIHTDAGDAANATFRNEIAQAPLAAVSLSDARDAMLIHIVNTDSSAHTIDKLVVGGKDATASACIPEKTLAPGQSTLITAPLCAPLAAGDAWTAAVTFTDAKPAVGVGRAIDEHFAIETWPSSADCPFPGGIAANYDDHRAKGFDTFFLHGGTYECGTTGTDFLANIQATAGVYALVTEDVAAASTPSHAIGILLGDESDSSYGKSSAPDSQPQAIATRSLGHWLAHPAAATYLGGSRNRLAGTYSGVADLAGMDFYVAACAPHATAFGNAPPLRGAYDYVRNTAENHAPLPTWLYAQGLHVGWDVSVSGTIVAHRQPNAAEAKIQAMSVIAAGGKGLMYFQTDLTEAKLAPDTWSAIGALNRDVASLGTRLARGGVTGDASVSTKDAIAAAIRVSDAIIVPVIDLASSSAPTDLGCAIGQDLHFAVSAQSVDLTVTIPDDLAYNDAFEVQGGKVLDVAPTITGRTLEVTGISLDAMTPTRLFVFAKDGAARADVKKALGL